MVVHDADYRLGVRSWHLGSRPIKLLDRLSWLLAEATAVTTSDLAREEARRNLAMKRADWLPAFELLMQKVEDVPSALFGLPVSLDENDRPLLCAAIRAGCTYFATGDRRDFGYLFGETVEQVQVVDLLSLAKLLGGDQG